MYQNNKNNQRANYGPVITANRRMDRALAKSLNLKQQLSNIPIKHTEGTKTNHKKIQDQKNK